MRRLTTMTAGWWWLIVAYGLSTALAVGAEALLVAAGCQDPMNAMASDLAGLCTVQGGGALLQAALGASIIAIVLTGVVFAIASVVRNLRPPADTEAYVLLTTVVVASGVSVLVALVAIPASGGSSLPVLLAAPAGLVSGLVAAPISGIVVGRILHRPPHR